MAWQTIASVHACPVSHVPNYQLMEAVIDATVMHTDSV